MSVTRDRTRRALREYLAAIDDWAGPREHLVVACEDKDRGLLVVVARGRDARSVRAALEPHGTVIEMVPSEEATA